jgi:hypothetical protein
MLVERVRSRISDDPEALAAFNSSLAFAGWHDHPLHNDLVVRVVSIDRFQISTDFPRLTAASVPRGVEDADYTIALPAMT